VEELVRAAGENPPTPKPGKKTDAVSKTPEEFLELQELLSKRLKTKVRFTIGKSGKGNIHIPFRSEEQLEQLLGYFDKLMN
jgi:hypothetical protein